MSQFEVVVADTHATCQIHHRLRYEVFCTETRFEDASRFPDQQEKDEYDDRAVPFLVRCGQSGAWLATARLILPGHGSLPVQRYCNLPQRAIPFEQMAELSRLLIMTHVRRKHRSKGRANPSVPLSGDRRARLQTAHILRDLIRAMAAYGLDRGIPHAAFFVTPALARILRRMHIDLSPIGTGVRHRGLRFPFISKATQVYSALTRITDRSSSTLFRPYRLSTDMHNQRNNNQQLQQTG